MLLQLIDITKLTELANKKEKAILAKLQSLSSAAIRSLEKAISYSEELANHVGGSGKSVASYRQEMVESANRLDTVKFHHLTNDYRSDVLKVTMLNWYKAQHKTLNEAETWVKLSNVINARKDENQKRDIQLLQSLQSEWKKQQKYAIYTSASLIALVEQAIPLFENYLDMLSTELHYYKSKLSRKTRTYIQSYMNTLKAEIKKEKGIIAHSMLIRLKAASSSNMITFDDVTVHFAKRLEQLGVLKENYCLPSQSRHDLDRNTLQYFQNYIAKWGNLSQIQQLPYLKWNRADNEHAVIKNGNQLLPVPKSMAGNINNDGILDTLFDREKERKKFLANQFGLLAHLRHLPNPKEDFTSLFTFCENDKWQHLCHLSETLSAENELAKGNLQSLSWVESFFNTSQFKFVDGWNRYLQRQRETLVNNMLAYATFISEQLRTSIHLKLNLEQVLSKQFKSQLESFDLALSLAMARAGLTKAKCSAYLLFLKQINQIKNLPRLELERRIEKLEEHYTVDKITLPVKEEEKQKDESQNERSFKPDEALKSPSDASKRAVSKASQVKELKGILAHLLSNSPLDLANNEVISTIDKIQALLDVIDVGDSLLSDLAETSKKLSIAYLQFWVNSKEEAKETARKASTPLAFILYRLFPSYQSAFQDLISSWDKYGWIVFQTKCYALLSTLEPDKKHKENYPKVLKDLLSANNEAMPKKVEVDKEITPSTHNNKTAFFHHNPSSPNSQTIHPPSVSHQEKNHAHY
jgi:hypothetical protein